MEVFWIISLSLGLVFDKHEHLGLALAYEEYFALMSANLWKLIKSCLS